MTSAPLLSDIEIAAFRDAALQGMQTPAEIWRRRTVQSDDGWGSEWYLVGSSWCWIYSTPTAVQSEVSGKIVTINTYRCYMPIDTNVIASDKILAGGVEYIVSDTISSNTWAPMLRVSLRFAE